MSTATKSRPKRGRRRLRFCRKIEERCKPTGVYRYRYERARRYRVVQVPWGWYVGEVLTWVERYGIRLPCWEPVDRRASARGCGGMGVRHGSWATAIAACEEHARRSHV